MIWAAREGHSRELREETLTRLNSLESDGEMLAEWLKPINNS